MLKQGIEEDLKTALLSGDHTLVTTLRTLKSVILYAEVDKRASGQLLSEAETIDILRREVKKRQESAALYKQANDTVREQAELKEIEVINKYLPPTMNPEELDKIITEVIADTGSDKQKIGQIIGLVKQKTAGQADGSAIAAIVKKKLE